jgi:hypothetical protein
MAKRRENARPLEECGDRGEEEGDAAQKKVSGGEDLRVEAVGQRVRLPSCNSGFDRDVASAVIKKKEGLSL